MFFYSFWYYDSTTGYIFTFDVTAVIKIMHSPLSFYIADLVNISKNATTVDCPNSDLISPGLYW
jgi:hypothetical protein